jgi:hypothetical protein
MINNRRIGTRADIQQEMRPEEVISLYRTGCSLPEAGWAC